MQVVISGLGQVSTVGTGIGAFRAGLYRRVSRPTPAADPWAKVEHSSMYQVTDGPGDAERVTGFALDAARQALTDARWLTGGGARLAVVLGTTLGDAARDERARVGLVAPRAPGTSAYSVAATIARQVGARAGATVVGNACAAGGYAISAGADLIRAGEVDAVLAGGVEGYSRVALACFNRMGAVDPQRCRPFDRNRAGTVFGEGAAMVLLESARHLRRRGTAVPRAILAGEGWSCDAHHPTAPEPAGTQVARAIRRALAAAGLTAAAGVGCVIPHGTGTPLNDAVESRVLHEVLGSQIPAYSLKALIGHTGGAAGGFGVLAAVLFLRDRAVPANVPIEEPDPECAVSLSEHTVPLAPASVLVNAYAFGGNNISLVVREA